jgi:hypothetical protein
MKNFAETTRKGSKRNICTDKQKSATEIVGAVVKVTKI